jgi:ribosomal-protein-alanine N-acetyltransferase
MDDSLYRTFFTGLPELRTSRLILRRLRNEDVSAVNEYASCPEVSAYLGWTPHLNLQETKGYIEFLQKRYRKGLHSEWGIALADSDKVIGTIGFTNVDITNECCELGYVLSSSYWGKGYMDEAMSAVLRAAFEDLKANRIVLTILEDNLPSIRFASRNGFRQEGREVDALYVKGEYRTVCRMAMLRAEYKSKT